jgi:hypothetical protein
MPKQAFLFFFVLFVAASVWANTLANAVPNNNNDNY